MINDSKRTALLIMDVQDGIIGNLPHKKEYVTGVQRAVNAARSRGISVIFVVVGFREGTPEITARNKFFFGFKRHAQSLIDARPAIETEEGDIIVTKRRFSTFTGSDLELLLRSHNVENLVLLGVATSGVVLSTTREAADKDYSITILSDLCVDQDEELQRVLLEKIFPRQAEVMTCQEWLKSLGQ